MSGRIEDRLTALEDLPELEPPEWLESRTLSEMSMAGRKRQPQYFARAAMWLVATAAGALLVAAALNFGTEQVAQPAAEPYQDLFQTYAAQSNELEQMLLLLPEPRRVMRADTASTIVGLEDRIAYIDAELSLAEQAQRPPEFRTALMRDRVEVMNALLYVRYGQSKAFQF
jgi:hypothetical protein